jgi:hypothetical protein
LVPVLELRRPDQSTRWDRYRTRAIAGFGGVLVTSVIIPLFVDWVKEKWSS